jgi:ABC-type polysaccharide/polyol phosphate transport system ATPase subunit
MRTQLDESAAAPPANAKLPNAIEVRELSKAFDIPSTRVDSLKERVVHPLARPETHRLEALRGVSFDVSRGEFFGIVGRNGTGKSTLLKILASIYRADSGTVAIAGRVAPFIELGVGFNQELTARENIVLNGVLMGLSRADAAARVDQVIEFAELSEFAELKLKNYSSGMVVRLAFSIMIQSDADVLLIDEVLAVGDASFQQKCRDVFHDIRETDRTVVLVTHDMTAVEEYCTRAMLLEGGDIIEMGDPGKVAEAYMRVNFSTAASPGETEGDFGLADIQLAETWLENSAGERTVNFEQHDPIELHATLVAAADVEGPSMGFMLSNSEGVDVCGFGISLEEAHGPGDRIAAGERIHVSATIDNQLAVGRYYISCRVYAHHSYADQVLVVPRMIDFVVYGTDHTVGIVSIFPKTSLERQAPGNGKPS